MEGKSASLRLLKDSGLFSRTVKAHKPFVVPLRNILKVSIEINCEFDFNDLVGLTINGVNTCAISRDIESENDGIETFMKIRNKVPEEVYCEQKWRRNK